MTLEEIKALPVAGLAAESSILFLWTIDKFVKDSFSVAEAWGFKPHVTLSWDKGNGLCLYGFHRRTEFCLVAFRGPQSIYPSRKAIPTSFAFKSPRHSAKPDEFYEMVAAAYSGPRIDLFARKDRAGYDVWGNEAPDSANTELLFKSDSIRIKPMQPLGLSI